MSAPKPNRIGNFLYNVDRALASLCWGTAQETISSEVGRIKRGEPQVGIPVRNKLALGFFRVLADWLDEDKEIWGVNHTANAIGHADRLDAVDDGQEQLRYR